MAYELVVRFDGAAAGLDRSGDLAGGLVEGGQVCQRECHVLFPIGSGELVGFRSGFFSEG
jgi:hypothetical protein